MKNKNVLQRCIPFTRKQFIFLLPKCVKMPLKLLLACYDSLKLKLFTIQAQCFFTSVHFNYNLSCRQDQIIFLQL